MVKVMPEPKFRLTCPEATSRSYFVAGGAYICVCVGYCPRGAPGCTVRRRSIFSTYGITIILALILDGSIRLQEVSREEK